MAAGQRIQEVLEQFRCDLTTVALMGRMEAALEDEFGGKAVVWTDDSRTEVTAAVRIGGNVYIRKLGPTTVRLEDLG